MVTKIKSFSSKLDKTLRTIKSPTLNVGFSDINIWADSGNFAMNRIMSGRFDRSFLFGRNYIFYGESGSGKSLQIAYVCANAQKEHNALIIWIDAEHATDDKEGQKWLKRTGLNLDSDNFMYISAATLEEIYKIVVGVSKEFRSSIANEEEVRPVIFAIDSWHAALTESQWDKTFGSKAGDLTGDQGQKAKQTGDVINRITHLCAGLPMMMLGVQSIMDNQEAYGRRHKTTGGNRMIYYASGCLLMTKKELKIEHLQKSGYYAHIVDEYEKNFNDMKEDVKKNAEKKFIGIIAQIENLKSRVSKPFEKIEVVIPYDTGVDPYSGLFELLMQEGSITNPSKGWYQYTDNDKEVKFRLKDFRDHADKIMKLSDSDISEGDEILRQGIEVDLNDDNSLTNKEENTI